MIFKKAEKEDFAAAYSYITRQWDYNTYNKEEIAFVYDKVLKAENTFIFFVMEDGEYKGMCHGDFFDTFWMSGETCYISSLITNEKDRGKGYGKALLDHVRELASQRGCKAMILDSGMMRTQAHKFYEKYGFEKSCYGFELALPK